MIDNYLRKEQYHNTCVKMINKKKIKKVKCKFLNCKKNRIYCRVCKYVNKNYCKKHVTHNIICFCVIKQQIHQDYVHKFQMKLNKYFPNVISNIVIEYI